MDFNQMQQFCSLDMDNLHDPSLMFHQSQDEMQCGYLEMVVEQTQHMEKFWMNKILEICHETDCKGNSSLPVTRIKKIMKSDGDVKMVSAETPVVVSKACEIFIQELSLRAWLFTQHCQRRTLQPSDVANAVRHDNSLQFLFSTPTCNYFIPKGSRATQSAQSANPSGLATWNWRDASTANMI